MKKLLVAILFLYTSVCIAGPPPGFLGTDSNGSLPVVQYDSSGNTIENDNPFPVNIYLEGEIDTGNSTDTSLAADTGDVDHIFTGTPIDVLDVTEIRVSVKTNVASATDGLQIQFSKDGTNWDWEDLYSIQAPNFKEEISVAPSAQYFRVIYTNGVTVQSYLRLSVLLKKVRGKPSNHRIKDTISGNDDCELTKSILSYGNTTDGAFVNVDVQAPMPVDGDSVYLKDVWVAQSDIGDFSGVVTDLFDNPQSSIVDSTANNPKEILIYFNRTIVSNVVGLGAYAGNFSNALIQIGNSGGVFTTVVDHSAINTKQTSYTFQLPVTVGFNSLKIQFHTTDTVTLSNCVILKTKGVVARLQAKKTDNTVTDINATNGGNLKVSLEELENTVSVNNNSQLRTTLFESGGGEFEQDLSTGAFTTTEYGHHKTHAGDHFYNKDWVDLANGATYDILVVTPNTTKWPHFLFQLAAEAEFNLTLYAGTTTSADGTSMLVVNRNGNSATANGMLVYHTPTITDVGTQIGRYKGGAGKLVGGEARAANEQILTQNTKFLVRITNDTTSNNWVDWLLDWYEHTNR